MWAYYEIPRDMGFRARKEGGPEKQFSCGFKSDDRVTRKPSIFRSHSLTTDVAYLYIELYIESDNISFSVSRF